MGLKTTNYQVKAFNTTLPTAYAYVTKCETDRTKGRATIGVFATREDAENPKITPYEQHSVEFTIDRAENDRATAYVAAKSPRLKYVRDETTGIIKQALVDGPFAGCVDDIV